MPSPFPGMDPYLEDPDIWPDFHDRLADEINSVLNQILPAPYYARLESRPELGVVDLEAGVPYTRRIIPDVGVVSPEKEVEGRGGVALLDAPRTTVSESIELVVPSEEAQHRFVEVRDPRRRHRLVTLIEIVSPSNKRRGVDRQEYLRKHGEVYDSDASIIELDLLRGGERILHSIHIINAVEERQPPPDYVVLINRAWRRTEEVYCQVFPIALREMLPVILVPLREGEAEVPLDLQYVFNHVYDRGPYLRGAVDYTEPPNPPLRAENAAWAAQLLRERGILPA